MKILYSSLKMKKIEVFIFVTYYLPPYHYKFAICYIIFFFLSYCFKNFICKKTNTKKLYICLFKHFIMDKLGTFIFVQIFEQIIFNIFFLVYVNLLTPTHSLIIF